MIIKRKITGQFAITIMDFNGENRKLIGRQKSVEGSSSKMIFTISNVTVSNYKDWNSVIVHVSFAWGNPGNISLTETIVNFGRPK